MGHVLSSARAPARAEQCASEFAIAGPVRTSKHGIATPSVDAVIVRFVCGAAVRPAQRRDLSAGQRPLNQARPSGLHPPALSQRIAMGRQ